MPCILCRFLRRLIDRDLPGWSEAADKKWRALQTAGTNTDALFEREPDPERICRAHALSDHDPAGAFAEFLALANGGSIWSMGVVAWACEVGQGTSVDLQRAEDWYRRAEAGGSDLALLGLARLAVARHDTASAAAMLEKGVGLGSTSAMRELALLRLRFDHSRQGRASARALLDQACAGGDTAACLELTRAMAFGRFGLRHVVEGWRSLIGLLDQFHTQVGATRARL